MQGVERGAAEPLFTAVRRLHPDPSGRRRREARAEVGDERR